MSKTAEQVAIDILDQRTNLSAELVVAALRREGWLREAPNLEAYESFSRAISERDEARNRIATLERDLAAAKAERDDARRTRTIEFDKRREAEAERDEARSCVAASNKTIAAWQNDYYDAKSREASPAMLRVVEAARKWLKFYRTNALVWADEKELAAAIAAVDALAAPAVEKPLERWLVVENGGGGHYTHDTEASARQHAKERGGLRVVHLREVNDAEAAR